MKHYDDSSRQIGRPSVYTTELAHEIIDRIANTTTNLVDLCKQNAHWPCYDTVNRWKSNNSDFYELYLAAMVKRAYLYAEEAIAIADNRENDYTYNEQGEQVANIEHLQRSKMRIEIRKWYASKLAHQTFGEKLQTTTTLNVISYADQLKALEDQPRIIEHKPE